MAIQLPPDGLDRNNGWETRSNPGNPSRSCFSTPYLKWFPRERAAYLRDTAGTRRAMPGECLMSDQEILGHRVFNPHSGILTCHQGPFRRQ